jgi:hypothetical protein
MAIYFTEHDLQKELKRRIGTRNQSDVASEIGVSASFLSMVINGYPFTGKIVKWLGYQKVKERLFVRIEGTK